MNILFMNNKEFAITHEYFISYSHKTKCIKAIIIIIFNGHQHYNSNFVTFLGILLYYDTNLDVL
jgi:hypothetical protein